MTAAELEDGALTIGNDGDASVDAVVSVLGVLADAGAGGGEGLHHRAQLLHAGRQEGGAGERQRRTASLQQTIASSSCSRSKARRPAGACCWSTGCRRAWRSRTRGSSTRGDVASARMAEAQQGSRSTPSFATIVSSPPSTSSARAATATRARARKPSATLAYVVRAVTPGSFVHPAATVEDMYRPDRFARTAAGRLDVAARGTSVRGRSWALPQEILRGAIIMPQMMADNARLPARLRRGRRPEQGRPGRRGRGKLVLRGAIAARADLGLAPPACTVECAVSGGALDRPTAAGARRGRVGERGRSQRSAAARFHHRGWALAFARRGRSGRSALPGHADGLRGPALSHTLRRRCVGGRARDDAGPASRAHRLWRFDADHAGGALARRRARAHRCGQAQADAARPAAGKPAVQG